LDTNYNMRRYKVLYLISLLLVSCSDPNAPACLQKKGGLVELELIVNPFTSIEVFDQFTVNISQGAKQQVLLKARSNQINGIKYGVVGNNFTLRDENSCTWVRATEFPTINITHPNLTELRLSGGWNNNV